MVGKLRHIIFDVSGTLWDDKPQVINANLNVLRNNGFNKAPCGSKLTYEWLGSNLKGSCNEMFRFVGLDGEDKQLEGLYKAELEQTSRTYPVVLFDGIGNLLAKINNRVGLSVISAHPQNRLEEDLKRLKVLDYFEDVFGSCHDKVELIRESAKRVNQGEGVGVAYVGDTSSDMHAANKAGVMPIGVSYGYQNAAMIEQAKPAIVVPCVNSLGKYLESLI